MTDIPKFISHTVFEDSMRDKLNKAITLRNYTEEQRIVNDIVNSVSYAISTGIFHTISTKKLIKTYICNNVIKMLAKLNIIAQLIDNDGIHSHIQVIKYYNE